jgi:transcription elongation GreA/GreB family factor
MNRFCHSALLLLVVCLLLSGGCSNGNTEKSLWGQIKEMGNQKSELSIRVEKLEQENQQLDRRIKTLQGIDPNERLSVIDTLEKIAITSRSGFYDKDNDGKKETLVVYLETADSAGDRIKAAGRVEVQLWNLEAKDSHKALARQWTIEPAQLKTCWAGTLMTDYYRFTFPVEDIAKEDMAGLTIKVKFVDYLSGKILEDQRVVR